MVKFHLMKFCKCGCQQVVQGKKVFVNKEHQFDWMSNGGASRMNALQPIEAKIKGGKIVGRQAAASGRLHEAALKGGARSREIAQAYREKIKLEQS